MTIYDIAREAGVSASTVSRVINNKAGIKESTRKKVQKLLDEYNYTPDVAARGLVTQASKFIGILIEDIRVSHHTESAYVIEQEMTRQGYTCITFSTGADSKRKAQYIEILEQRRVEGAIFIGSMFGTEAVRQSVEQHLSNTPVVIVNGALDLPNTYSVLIDEERGTEECVALLTQKGRKQLAYLMDVATPANEKKNRGFCTGMLRSGRHHRPPQFGGAGPVRNGRTAQTDAGCRWHPLRYGYAGHWLYAGAEGAWHRRAGTGGSHRCGQHVIRPALHPCIDHAGQQAGGSQLCGGQYAAGCAPGSSRKS